MSDDEHIDDSERNARLDVESDDDRERRIRRLLRKTDSKKGTASSQPRTGSSSNFGFGVHDTHALTPPTQLLERVQQFLPQMEAANALLEQRAQANPESVDIEHLDHPDAQYIEMNLGLGVFSMRAQGEGNQSSTDSDADSNGDDTSSSSSSEASDSSSDSDSNSESSSQGISSAPDTNNNTTNTGSPSLSADSGTSIHDFLRLGSVDEEEGLHPQRPMRPLPNRTRPSIVVLGEADDSSTPEREQSS